MAFASLSVTQTVSDYKRGQRKFLCLTAIFATDQACPCLWVEAYLSGLISSSR